MCNTKIHISNIIFYFLDIFVILIYLTINFVYIKDTEFKTKYFNIRNIKNNKVYYFLLMYYLVYSTVKILHIIFIFLSYFKNTLLLYY